MKNTKPIIELKNVWKTFTMGENQVHALRGINLKVMPGEFVAIKGPSGSGKSTAMNLVGALDVPTRGTVLLEGDDISEMEESDLAQIRGKKIGFIFQKFNLISTLTALENVMLPMTFQGTPKEERVKKATKLLEMVGLGDRTDHKPGELSGGQNQRVAIARALVNNPDVILADEPTGNLDSRSGENVLSFLEELHDKQNKTIVMVTHDDELAEYAERIEYLRDGTIISTTKGKNHARGHNSKSKKKVRK
ncbi:ABC transporter ATP-binding protein [Candidatus Woesearchaeota archaeon]|nr:ABC transporter ATP-binding protein [Candidatus Woesearchaeota archaeon]